MNSKSLFEAFTRSVPPFNACFEAGLAAGFARPTRPSPAKIAATSIITPRLVNTADSSVFLRI